MFLFLLLALMSTLSYADARWEQVGLAIIGEENYDRSGYSVAMSADGSTLAIGSTENDDHGENKGHIRVYKFNPDMDGGVWLQLGQDIDGAKEHERSGGSVAMSADGSRLAIGSIDADNSRGTRYSGLVKIFDFDPDMDGGVWIQVGADIEGEDYLDEFGDSLAMNGEGSKIVIGGPGHGGPKEFYKAGHARVYEYTSGNWVQVGRDMFGTDDYDGFGSSVSMNSAGSHIAIAAGESKEDDYGPGAVRVYENRSGSWEQVGTTINGESIGDGAVVSMSSSGLMVTIGSMSANADYSGQVRVFKYDGEGWVQVGQDIDGEAAGDQSGETVVMSADGSMLAIGATMNDGNGMSFGHVRVYELQNEMWVQLGDDIDGEQHEDSQKALYFGSSLTMSADGSMLAIGGEWYQNNRGHVKVYKLDRGVVDQDCEGTFISCTSACEKSAERKFTKTQEKSGNGKECPAAADCMPLDGACPDNIDCEGSWSTCTAACETSAQRTFAKTVAKSGNGKECPAAADCMPLDGACTACEDIQPPVWYGNNSCAKQKSAGKCPMRVQENSMYCRKTCGMCGSDYTIPDCHDIQPPSHWKNNSCAKQKAGNKCDKRKQKNSVYCRKTCGICGDAL